MPLHVSRVHAICFDVDGTLSDTDDVMVAQLAELLFPFHFLFPGKDIIHLARGIVMETEAPANFLIGIPDLIGLDNEIFALKDWVVRKSKIKTLPFQIIPGTKEMLEELNKDYPLAVVSARDTSSTMDFLNQFELVPTLSASPPIRPVNIRSPSRTRSCGRRRKWVCRWRHA